MVTCQSANQLKTPAKFFWYFKMVSHFGSLGYTIMGKTADLTVIQKTIIDTLHKEGKPQTFIAKEAGCSQSAVSKHVNRKLSGRKKCGRKRGTTNRENRSLMRIVKKNRFTRNGLRLGSRPQEPPHTDVSRNLATVVVRDVLPGLRRRRTGLLPGGLLVLVHCVFWKPTSLHPFAKKFWSTSCFLLLTSFLKMHISFSSRIWHLPTLPKAPKVGYMTMVLVYLTGQQTHQTWTP